MANTRKETLTELLHELSWGLTAGGFVKRIGNVFFRCGHSGCVQRDVVFQWSKRHGLNFELLSLDWSYFTGSKDHAFALRDALGGRCYPSEYVSVVDGMDLWIWEGPERQQQAEESRLGEPHCLDLQTLKDILFDEDEA